jgi:hypothetical protein
MKKLMLVLGLMGIVVFSYASETKESRQEFEFQKGLTVEKDGYSNARVLNDDFFDCTMSATVTLTVGVAKLEVSCSASGATCEQALATAEGCVTAVVKRIITAIK